MGKTFLVWAVFIAVTLALLWVLRKNARPRTPSKICVGSGHLFREGQLVKIGHESYVVTAVALDTIDIVPAGR